MSSSRAYRPRRLERDLQPRRRDPRGGQQHLGDRRRRGVRRDRRPAQRRGHPGRGRRAPGEGDHLHPRPRRPRARRPELRERVSAPILLHPDDKPVWELTHTDHLWDVDLEDGQTIKVGGAALKVLHTPGHAPGAICLYVHDLGCVFTGDTLFQGGPGRHRSVLQRRGPDQGLDPRHAVRTCPTRRSCTPATATTPRSGRSAPSWRDGGAAERAARPVFTLLLGLSLAMFLTPGEDVPQRRPERQGRARADLRRAGRRRSLGRGAVARPRPRARGVRRDQRGAPGGAADPARRQTCPTCSADAGRGRARAWCCPAPRYGSRRA